MKHPQRLYKFQSCNNPYSIENLKQSEIRFSKPANLNDPFDCAIPVVFTYKNNDVVEFVTQYYFEDLRKQGKSEEIPARKRQYLPNGKPSPELIESTKKISQEKSRQAMIENENCGVACFTQKMNNLLMWSHYADGHKGFCLEFDTTLFLIQAQPKYKEVIYSNSYPKLSLLDIKRAPDRLYEPLRTKSKDWTYEEEWRLIMKEGNLSVKYDPKALTAVYFGCLMNDEKKAEIASISSISTTRLFNMKRSQNKYILEVEPYTR